MLCFYLAIAWLLLNSIYNMKALYKNKFFSLGLNKAGGSRECICKCILICCQKLWIFHFSEDLKSYIYHDSFKERRKY